MENLDRQIEEKRKILNELMKSDYRSNYEQIISLSQELDELILKQTKTSLKKNEQDT